MRTIEIVGIVIGLLVSLYVAMIAPDIPRYLEHRRLSQGYRNLLLLIEAEDTYYSQTGTYLPLPPLSDQTREKDALNWCTSTDCSSCEYGVAVSGGAYTATVRCPVKDGAFNYLGFVKTEPGKHRGVDGPFGICQAQGIFTHQRPLVNTVGPCIDQEHGILSVVSGHAKRLVIKTFPSNASIRSNGEIIGDTSSQHNTISPQYGSFFWAEPPDEPVTITITKAGYHPVEFTVNWSSYTYTSIVVLHPE